MWMVVKSVPGQPAWRGRRHPTRPPHGGLCCRGQPTAEDSGRRKREERRERREARNSGQGQIGTGRGLAMAVARVPLFGLAVSRTVMSRIVMMVACRAQEGGNVPVVRTGHHE
jgi:hypothetical protein